MYKGLSALELLFVLFLLSMLASVGIPVWKLGQDELILAKEQQKLFVFLRQMQARAENSDQIWFVIANRRLEKQEWCLTVQLKQDQVCDCFLPHLCPENTSANFYYPYFPQRTMLVSKRYYPQEITRLSGIRDTATTNCFILQANQSRSLFSFFNVGSLKLKDHQALSACVRE